MGGKGYSSAAMMCLQRMIVCVASFAISKPRIFSLAASVISERMAVCSMVMPAYTLLIRQKDCRMSPPP